MSESITVTIFSLLLLVSNIVLLVMSGVGYTYFKSEMILKNVNVNMKVMFGCGIGLGLFIFAGILVFLAWPEFPFNWIITIPSFIIISILYVVYTRPNMNNQYISNYNSLWDKNDSVLIEFQWKYGCCGYNNALDRGIPNCPFEFESGCSKIIDNYLKLRFKEVYIASIFMVCLFVVSIVALIIYQCFKGSFDESNLFEDIIILGDLF